MVKNTGYIFKLIIGKIFMEGREIIVEVNKDIKVGLGPEGDVLKTDLVAYSIVLALYDQKTKKGYMLNHADISANPLEFVIHDVIEQAHGKENVIAYARGGVMDSQDQETNKIVGRNRSFVEKVFEDHLHPDNYNILWLPDKHFLDYMALHTGDGRLEARVLGFHEI